MVESRADIIEVNLNQAVPLSIDAFKAGLVPSLISSPGIGKSALAKQIAKKYNLYLIDIRLTSYDPADLNGFPFILNKDERIEAVKCGHVPIDIWPISSDPLPVGPDGHKYAGWLILLDEFPSATLAVQSAAYKLVLDKMVGMHRLHSAVWLMTAGNSIADKAIVMRQGTAMQSRLSHLRIKVCVPTWIKWAVEDDLDHRVISLIRWKEDMLHRFDPNHTDLTFPCPRTWHMTSDLSKLWTESDEVPIIKLPIIAGTVGVGAGREYRSYTEVFGTIATVPEILANPATARLGDQPSMHYAAAGLVSNNITPDNAQPMVQFLSRLNVDFQVIGLRSAIKKDPALKREKAILSWVADNADELVGAL